MTLLPEWIPVEENATVHTDDIAPPQPIVWKINFIPKTQESLSTNEEPTYVTDTLYACFDDIDIEIQKRLYDNIRENSLTMTDEKILSILRNAQPEMINKLYNRMNNNMRINIFQKNTS
jgi:hypothetical protein